MGIGTSKGAFYDSEAHFQASQWDNRYDNNVVTPNDMKTNKELDKVEEETLGIPVKDVMPFPDNRNPDSDFNSRFGNLPPSGILNDIKKPKGETVPLVRKISNDLVIPNKMGITDQDIDTGISVALGAAGGGLHTTGEKVGRAALKYGDEIFTGVNHGDALDKILSKMQDFDYKHVSDGFITTHGRFVSRAEALEIAEQAKQVYKKQGVVPGLELTSEELIRGK